MLTLEQTITKYGQCENFCKYQGLAVSLEELNQITAWLRELQERRKMPEVVFCKDCKAIYCDFCLKTLKPVNKEKDYCSLAERRTDEAKRSD